MDAHVPAFVSIFQDAAKYGDILSEEPEELSYSSSETSSISSHTRSSEDGGGESDSVAPSGRVTPTVAEGDQEQQKHPLSPSPEKIDKMMSKLMLNEQFKASTARLVGLSVNTFTQQGGPSGMNMAGEATSDAASDSSVSTGDADELNDRVIPLLASEFGTITEEGEEERLLFESDGAYFQEVAILGVIHLTTHRITFHASLLSTRPDLMSHSGVIKTGPVIVHRNGTSDLFWFSRFKNISEPFGLRQDFIGNDVCGWSYTMTCCVLSPTQRMKEGFDPCLPCFVCWPD